MNIDSTYQNDSTVVVKQFFHKNAFIKSPELITERWCSGVMTKSGGWNSLKKKIVPRVEKSIRKNKRKISAAAAADSKGQLQKLLRET